MLETKKITAGLDVILNKYVILYHSIQGFINIILRKNNPNKTFKLRFYNIYETIELADGETSSAANNSPIVGVRHQ